MPVDGIIKGVISNRPRHCAFVVALFAATALCAVCSAALLSSDLSRSRYDIIESKQPFGPPPPPVKTAEELAEEERLRAIAEEAARLLAEEQMPEVIPEGLANVRITQITRYKGIPRIGFIDSASNRSYSLAEGEGFEGFVCESVDIDNALVRLSRDGLSATLPIWINPATTNRGDVTTFGQPNGQPVDLAAIAQNATTLNSRARMDEARDRRAQLRKDRDERRKQHEEEWAALTPEEREDRLHKTAVQSIINGDPPPPVELDEVDLAELEAAGFDVDSIRAATALPAETSPRQRRQIGRRITHPARGDEQ